MSWVVLASVGIATAVTAWLLTRAYITFALARGVLDVPNARSSHVVSAPRGGGIAILLATIVGTLLLAALGAVEWRPLVGLLGGGVLVGLVGLADDVREVSPRWRLVGHFGAAAWFLWWEGSVPQVSVFGFLPDSSWWGFLLAGLFLVWVINLTNFMDGIDGIAGVEGVTVALAGAVVCAVLGSNDAHTLIAVILATATAGFLAWNWPPARIFLGDVGSGFLGFMLGALSLEAGMSNPALFWSWTILLGVFVVDATVTLLRRLARLQKLHEAHRSHAYQHAAQRCGHRSVTLAVALANLLWLFPIALLVALKVLNGPVGLIIAYIPLVVGAIRLGAGSEWLGGNGVAGIPK